MLRTLDHSYEICQNAALELLVALKIEFSAAERATIVNKTLTSACVAGPSVQHAVIYHVRFAATFNRATQLLLIRRLAATCRERLEGATLKQLASTPVYPLLSALHALSPQLALDDAEIAAAVRSDVLEIGLRVAHVVEPVLHNLSPEGVVLTEDGDINPIYGQFVLILLV